MHVLKQGTMVRTKWYSESNDKVRDRTCSWGLHYVKQRTKWKSRNVLVLVTWCLFEINDYYLSTHSELTPFKLWITIFSKKEYTAHTQFNVSSNKKPWGINEVFSSKLPTYTIKSLWFHLIQFTSTIYVTIFAAESLDMKILIDICSVLCKIWK